VTRIRPDHAVADVRGEICSLGHFFHSPDAATEWLDHTPDGTVVTVEDDFLTTRQAAIDLGWTTS
jgi:alkylmercury lyase